MKKIYYTMFATMMAVGCGNGYDSVDAKKFAEVIEDSKVQIIDTRTPEEFSEGHIPGAISLDLDREDFFDQLDSLDKSRPVAVYCRGGRRSKIAAERFVSKGYEVTELEGGLITWEGEIEK